MGLRPRAAPSPGRPLRRRGAPRLRDPARRTMRLVFAVVLVTQLDRVEALACGLGEYPVGAECCPMCAAGLRVFKHCTANSSTTCIPCVEDTYTDHPNGLEHCRKCKLCDKGANLVPEVACTYTKNTVCGCLPGYFCSYLGTEDCELCQRYTVCFPGSMVKERGTKTTDNVCEACPPGTSSTANMSYSCIPSPTVKENGRVQGDDSNPSSDPSVTAIVVSVVGIVLVVAAALTYIWQRRRRKNYVPPVQESGELEPDLSPGGSMGKGKTSCSFHSGKHRNLSSFPKWRKRPSCTSLPSAMKRPTSDNKKQEDEISKQK